MQYATSKSEALSILPFSEWALQWVVIQFCNTTIYMRTEKKFSWNHKEEECMKIPHMEGEYLGQSIGFSECLRGSEYVPSLTAVPVKTY